MTKNPQIKKGCTHPERWHRVRHSDRAIICTKKNCNAEIGFDHSGRFSDDLVIEDSTEYNGDPIQDILDCMNNATPGKP